ncbi:MAG: DUF120 domain-containing protein [Thermoplasmatota archaeon]
MLKHLAKLGALHDHVYTSSGELAKRVGVSQQTASRQILALLDRGLLARKMAARRQLLRLTAAGAEALRREYADYKLLFKGRESMTLRGRVVTGLGEGRYYLSREGYQSKFKELLGFDAYPGTLNVEVDALDRDKLTELKETEARLAPEFQSEGRTFGAVKLFPAEVNGVECAAIFPLRSHHTTVLELISPHFLRKKLDVKDGADVTVSVETNAPSS